MQFAQHVVEGLESRRLLSAAGDFDPTFGTGGIVSKSFGGTISDMQVILQLDEKPIVSMVVTPASPAKPELVIARFDTNGKLDSGFGNAGTATVSLDSAQERLSDVVLDKSGRVLVWVGQKLLRFSTSGQLQARLTSAPMAIQSRVDSGTGNGLFTANGDLVESGLDTAGTEVRWLLPNGSVDKSVGKNGSVTIPFTVYDGQNFLPFYPSELYPESDGSILSAVSGGNPDYNVESGVVRIDADGHIDTSFGNDGLALGAAYYLNDLALTKSGNILEVSSDDEGGTYLSEFDANGQNDTNFGQDGPIDEDAFGIQGDFTFSQAYPTPDGKIIVDGSKNDSNSTFTIGRLNANGTLDATFGPGDSTTPGEATPNFPSPDDIAVAADQSILLASVDGSTLKLARLQGVPTPTLSTTGTLELDGTAADDKITFAESNGKIIATINGVSTDYDALKVKAIQSLGYAGNDKIENLTSLPCTIYGNSGNDTLVGGSSGDLLLPGRGNNSINGGGGRDTLAYDDLHATIFHLSNTSGDVMSIQRFTSNFNTFETDTFSGDSAFTVRGTPEDDSFDVVQAADPLHITLDGGAGDDDFDNQESGAGNISLMTWYGGAGNDTFSVGDEGAPPLKILGGDGNDYVDDEQFMASSYDAIDLGAGKDEVFEDQDVFSPVTLYAGAGVETLIGPTHGDGYPITMIGNHLNNLMINNCDTGNVTLLGGAGNDQLVDEGSASGNSPPNVLNGGSGNDTLWCGASPDSLIGGDGNDEIHAKNGQVDTVDGGPGDDIASVDRSASVRDILHSIETLV